MADINDITQGMLGPTNNIENYIKKTSELTQEIKDVADKFSNTFDDAVKEANKKQDKRRKREDKTFSITEKLASTLNKIEKALSGKNPNAAPNAIPGGVKSTLASAPSIKAGTAQAQGVQYGNNFSRGIGMALGSLSANVTRGLLGGTDLFSIITKDMFEQEYDFAMGMKLINYQTQAAIDNSAVMNRTTKEVRDTIARTGYDLTTFEQTLLRASKRGLKDAKSITTMGLNLGKMMGLNEDQASQISDKFADWNQYLGMSENTIADVSRGIQNISRQTGLVGEQLLDVVHSSERFLKEMRNAGTLTAESANNMMLMAANAKKLGVEDSFNEIGMGLSSGANLLLKSSAQTRSLLLQAAASTGRIREAMDGTLTETKAGIKDLAIGYEKVFKNISGGVNIDDIDKLSATQKSMINIRVQSAFGMSIEEYRRQVQLTRQSGMGYQETLMDIDKQLGINATSEEKRAAALKKQDLFLTTSLSFSTKLAEAAKNAKSFDEAIDQMKQKMSPKQWEEQQKELAEVAGTFSKSLQAKVQQGDKTAMSQAMGLSAAEAIKQKGGEDFTSDIQKAIRKNDMAGFRTIQEKMNAEQQRLGIETVTKLDPIEDMAQSLREINAMLRAWTGAALVGVIGVLGKTGLIATLLATNFAGMSVKLLSLKNILTNVFGWFKGGGLGGVLGKTMSKFGQLGGLRGIFTKMGGWFQKMMPSLGQLGGLRGTFTKMGGWFQKMIPAFGTGGTGLRGILTRLGPMLSEFSSSLGSWITKALPTFTSIFRGIGTTLTQYIGPALMTIFRGIGTTLTQYIGPALMTVIRGIGTTLTQYVGPVLMTIVRGIGTALTQYIGPMLMTLLRGLGSVLVRFVLPMIMTVLQGIVGVATTLFAPLIAAIAPIIIPLTAIAAVVGGLGLIAYKAYEYFSETAELAKKEKEREVTISAQLDKSTELMRDIAKNGSDTDKAEAFLIREDKISSAQKNLKKSKEYRDSLGWFSSTGAKEAAESAVRQDEAILKNAQSQLEEFKKATGILGVSLTKEGLYVQDAKGNRLLTDVNDSLENKNKAETKKENPAAKAPIPPKNAVNQPVNPKVPRQKSVVELGVQSGGADFLAMNKKRLDALDEFNVRNNQGAVPNAQDDLLRKTIKDNEGAVTTDKIVTPMPRFDLINSPGLVDLPVPATKTEPQVKTTPPQTPPPVQPTPLTDVHARMQQEYAVTTANAKKSSVPQTAELVAINQNQLQYLMNIHGDLEQLITLMSPSKSSGNSGPGGLANTKPNTQPPNATNYNKWQFGRYSQNASIGVISDGKA